MFIILVSRRVPGIVQYTLNLYKLLTNAFNMSVKPNVAEVHRYWQRAAGGIPHAMLKLCESV